MIDNSQTAALLVYAEEGGDIQKARALADRLHAGFTEEKQEADRAALVLSVNREGLALTGGGQTLRGDFLRMLPRLKPNNLNGEMLVRAARGKSLPEAPTVIDATAGLGEDSFLLAAAGFTVTLYEYDPVIAALLRDALDRAAKVPELCGIVSRMCLREGDSIAALPALTEAPDVVLLDPMFPERQKSALVKKKFQLLHRLERPCPDEKSLVGAAMAARPRKIIIKRPLKGAFLAGIKPSYSLVGKAIRYDCLILPREENRK